MNRFEAVYYEGEVDERAAAWQVIEWTHVNSKNGAMSGNVVQSFFEDEEHLARELAEVLQENYNLLDHNTTKRVDALRV